MSEMSLDDALRELQRELAVVPSPGFSAGVRERVSRESRSHGQRWVWLAAAAALAAVATAAIVWSRPANRVVVPDLRVAAGQTTPAPAVAAATAPAPIVAETPRNTRRARSASVALARPADRPTASGLDLTVVTNQPAILRRMLTAAASLPAEASVAYDANPSSAEIQPLEVPLLKVDLIVVTPLIDPIPGPVSGVVPTIRRVAAEIAVGSN
jgi:hypothetical protein